MNRFLALSLLAATSACTADRPMAASHESHASLATELGDRVAGPPQDCVNQRDLRGNHSAGEAIVFDTLSRDLVYVNSPSAGCPSLEPGRTLITNTPTSQLCRGDIVRVVDLTSRASYGGCGLGQFVPYRRPR